MPIKKQDLLKAKHTKPRRMNLAYHVREQLRQLEILKQQQPLILDDTTYTNDYWEAYFALQRIYENARLQGK